MSCRHFLVAVPILFSLAGCGEPPDNGPGQPVAHRRAAFLTILKAFEPMGVSLREKQYAPDQFVAMAKHLQEVKDGPWSYFTADSNYPPTHATDKVWSEPEKFAAERQAFSQATDKLVAAAATRNEDKVLAAYDVLQQTCSDCHKVFKRK